MRIKCYSIGVSVPMSGTQWTHNIEWAILIFILHQDTAQGLEDCVYLNREELPRPLRGLLRDLRELQKPQPQTQ